MCSPVLLSLADNQAPIWSADGSHLIYSRSNRTRNLFWRPVNGGPEERLTSGDTVQFPDSTTPDGKTLAFTQWTGANADIYLLQVDGNHTRARSSLRASTNRAACSRQMAGGWPSYPMKAVAMKCTYGPFGHEGARSVVSTGGGVRPMWDHEGKHLYYSAGDAVMQVVFNSATGNIGQATAALRLPPRTAVFGVTPAGDFVGIHTLSENFTATELEVTTEWFRELNARVPVPH